MKSFILSLIAFVVLCTHHVNAQNNATVFDPNATVTYLDPNAPRPSAPANNNIVYKWYATKRMSWDATVYKAYVFNNMAFRVRFPKNYNAADQTKKYPVLIYLHGAGEVGNIYDNEQQLVHGGQTHSNAVQSGKFDGFVIYPQNAYPWYNSFIDNIAKFLTTLTANTTADANRISVGGLSMGGEGALTCIRRYPTLFASAHPMSSIGSWGDYDKILQIPIWASQGALDVNPRPAYTETNINNLRALGADITYTLYPNLGHGVWNSTFANADYFPYLSRVNKTNPLVYFGRTEFCIGDAINVKLGLTAGFDGYEWRKDGTIIPGATANIYQVTQLGTYEARIKRGTVWSSWTVNPVIIKLKEATISPTITVAGIASKVLPATDGATTVTLQVPDGYAEYAWTKIGSTTVLSTAKQLTVSQPGEYTVKIKEFYGCSSNNSTPFKVIAATGSNGPDAAVGLIVSPLSKTEIQLNWNNTPNPVNNETAFEIYRSKTPGGAYKMAGIVGADTLSFKDKALDANTKYYYVIRAVNNNGAAPLSAESFASTQADILAPVAPGNLAVTGTSRTYIDLSWTESTDDVGVYRYDVYVNDQKLYLLDAGNTSFRVNNLTFGTIYNFKIAARDLSGNASVPSNQVTAIAGNKGFNYRYYESAASWSALPNFNQLTPVSTGKVENFDDPSYVRRSTNFGVVFEGFINIPVAGNYTFETYSDDGSKLYIGSYNPTAAALVNNDGAHGLQYREGTKNMTQGIHPFTVTYFQGGGGGDLKVYWKNTAHGVTGRQLIPKEYFSDILTPLSPPAVPSQVNAKTKSYDKIEVSWKDNANDENGYEIYRTEDALSPYNIVGKVAAGLSVYTDNKLQSDKRYFYKVKATSTQGESAVIGTNQEMNLSFNNSFADSSGFSRNATGRNGATFSTSIVKQGTHSLSLDGVNDYVDIGQANPGYLHTAFKARTISFWVNPQLLTNVRTLVDIGSSSNGISIRTNGSNLEVGVASNNSRQTLNTPVSLNSWFHVAVVYNTNSIKLYKNGELVSSNNNLPYTSIAATSDNSRIGYYNGSNAFNSNTNFYSKVFLDEFLTYDGALTADEVARVFVQNSLNANATTDQSPAPPANPVNVTATAISGTKISLKWNADPAGPNEIQYAVYRSVAANTNYIKIWKDSSSTAAFADTGLFANVTYYYKVKAINSGGESGFSAEAFAKTLNSKPVLAAIANKSIRFDEAASVEVTAKDADNDPLTFSVSTGYSFVTVEQVSASKAKLNINASVANIGSHSVPVYVRDAHGGTDTTLFNLVINQNYKPVISVNNTITINENEIKNIIISVADQNSTDSITFSLSGNVADFVSLINATNRTVTLALKPSFTHAGNYNFVIKADDQNGGLDSAAIQLEVKDFDPGYKLYVNFTGSVTQGGYWNNTTSPANNAVYTNFKNDKLLQTGIGIKVTSAWESWFGASNTNGVYDSRTYPLSVITSAWAVNNGTQSYKITGLDTALRYNLGFLSSSKYNDKDYTSTFIANGKTVSIDPVNNTSNLVYIADLQANNLGEIAVTVKSEINGVAHINAMIINAGLASTGIPAAPKNLLAAFDPSGKIRLSWTDPAYDESGFEIHRTDAQGQTTLIETIAANTTEYFDVNFIGNQQIKYQVRSINSFGTSAFSNQAVISTPNRYPSLTKQADRLVQAGETTTFDIEAFDDENETISITAVNLPSFVTLSSTGSGRALLTVTPNASQIGIYNNIIFTARDNFGGADQDTLSIRVIDGSITSVNINFTNYGVTASGNWNNMNANPSAGLTLSNLKDDIGTNTPLAITLVNSWEGYNDFGMTTGNNTGIYPDNVMKTFYYDSSNQTKQIRIKGMDAGKRYNFIFFASWKDSWAGGVTNYSIGTKTVSLDPANNLTETVQINNISADANGEALISVLKQPGASYTFIGSLTVQSYVYDNKPLTPTNLVATGVSKSSVTLKWQDQSDDENNYEIHRSATENGTYQLLSTIAANSTTFTNSGLSENTTYWYKVRAVKNDGTKSEFSNYSAGSTLAYTVSINFNLDNPAPSPWNNTSKNPEDGDRFINLVDGDNINTGITMTMVDNFTAVNSLGVVTGNNSGKYPDVVNKWFYYSEKNETVKIRFSGLNQNFSYDFEFFGSWMNPFANGNTSYTINGKTVFLNPANNTTKTVAISNINANENGEIYIDVFMPAEAQYAFLNALFVHAHAKVADGPQLLMATKGFNPGRTNNRQIDAAPVIVPYPNPFIDKVFLNLKQYASENTFARLELIDLNGRVLISQNVKMDAYTDQAELNLQQLNLNTGLYLIRLSGDKIKMQTFKLMKN